MSVIGMKQAFSIAEFCDRWNLSRSKIYNEISAGRLPIVKVGRRTLILREGEARWREQVIAESQGRP